MKLDPQTPVLTYRTMQHCMKSSKYIVPRPARSYFRISMSIVWSLNRYPKFVRAVFNSLRSMLPLLSRSKDRKQFSQSVTYFHNAPNSSKLTVPVCFLSNIPVAGSVLSNIPVSTKARNKIVIISKDHANRYYISFYNNNTLEELRVCNMLRFKKLDPITSIILILSET